MSRTKHRHNLTTHAFVRSTERSTFSKKEVEMYSKIAARKGLAAENICGNKALRQYVKARSRFKRVKVYLDYIWVFCNTSNRLITFYPVPEHLKKSTEFVS